MERIKRKEIIMKNRDRDSYSFANINLLGKCNVDCFFCLGKDIKDLLSKHNHLNDYFMDWQNFTDFINILKKNRIDKVYITGQNTDALLYTQIGQLIDYLHEEHFAVGLRTNGYLAPDRLSTIKKCDLSVGYSIHSLNSTINKMILGTPKVPDWEYILSSTPNCRVSIVLNRCNEYDFYDTVRFVSNFENVKYIQVRRVSTDTRCDLLAPDVAAYERVYTQVSNAYELSKKFVTDAEEYIIYGKPVVFWRTVKTSVNSMNYFTDGTISPTYFIVEGYLENYKRVRSN